MLREPIHVLVVLVVSLALWVVANLVQGTQEPWDSPYYLGFYLIALGLCAAFGYLLEERPRLWALIIIFAQLPVMVFSNGGRGDALIVVGLMFLTIQSLPAIFIATAASKRRKRQLRS